MPIHPVYGHERLLERLKGAIASDRFPATSMLSGPSGVGKQRIALSLAEALLCEKDGGSCGDCHSCRQVRGLAHPDLHWFVPFQPPKRRSSDPDKLIDEAAEAIAEIIAERRANPLYARPEPTASHPIASTRLIQRRLALKPFQGPRKVMILGDADRLVVQESSTEAANSLLKLLEEPPPGTYIMLTTSLPQSLLPTIRSRLVPIRVPPVAEDVVIRFLEQEMGVSGREVSKQAERARGAIGNLVAAKGRRSGAEGAERLLSAVKGGPVGRAALALSQPPWGARGDFTDMLDAAALRLRRQIADGAAANRTDLMRPLRALKILQAFREDAQRNVNPQLGIALLSQQLGQIQ